MTRLLQCFSISLYPRRAIHPIVKMGLFYRFWLPILLYTIGMGFLPFILPSQSDTEKWGAAALVLVYPLLSAASIVIWAAVLRWMGRWIGGQGTRKEFRTLLAWALAPTIVALYASLPFARWPWVFPLLLFLAWIWSLVIQIRMISEIQKFSIGRAIANICLPLFSFLILCFGLTFLVLFLTKGDSKRGTRQPTSFSVHC